MDSSRYFMLSLTVPLAFICLASWRAPLREAASATSAALPALKAAADAPQWRQVYRQTIFISPSRRITSFAAGGTILLPQPPTAAFFLSTDNGASWRPINTGLPLNEGIGLVAINGKDFYAALMSV
jgi:hypothetical protein